MADDFDKKMDFFGDAMELAETNFSASFDDDEDSKFLTSLYEEYQRETKRPKAKIWLQQRLAAVFQSANKPPKWFDEEPEWPFASGKPMVFIEQLEVKSNPVTKKSLSPKCRLYVFGARVKDTDGWRMDYRIVEKDPDFENLVADMDEEGTVSGIRKSDD
jgi:hypothetical protein